MRPADARARALVERTGETMLAALLEIGDGNPGFAGAVLTLMLAHVLAMLDPDDVAQCIDMHASRAVELGDYLRKKETPH